MTTVAKKNNKLTAPIPLHRILREVLRHYMEFRDIVGGYGGGTTGIEPADGRKHILYHGYWVYNEDGSKCHKEDVEISFWDLHKGLQELAPRKREAIFYNVILDMKQKDVAKIMGITTVSVGQYVEAGTIQLAKTYFAECPDAV